MTLDQLTSFEREVLALRIDYYSFREIGERLGVATSTGSMAMSRVMRKYEAKSLGELYRRARLQLQVVSASNDDGARP